MSLQKKTHLNVGHKMSVILFRPQLLNDGWISDNPWIHNETPKVEHQTNIA